MDPRTSGAASCRYSLAAVKLVCAERLSGEDRAGFGIR